MKTFVIALMTLLLGPMPSACLAQDRQGTAGIFSLVGMQIRPAIPGKKQGDIPAWNSISGRLLSSASNDSRYNIVVEEGYVDSEGGFIVINLDIDLTQRILDAKVIPKELRQYDVVHGKAIWNRNAANRFRLSSCELPDGRGVIGIMRPEVGKSGCMHWSRRVKRAWQFNETTAKLQEILPTGIRCYHSDAEDECKP